MNYPQLNVVIDHKAKTARFSGPGTFAAKDLIKSLGSAKWLGALKQWEVAPFTTPLNELKILFPDISIEQSNTDSAEESNELLPVSGKNIPTGVSVGALIGKVRSVLQAAFPGTIYVYGVISSVKERGEQAFIDLAEQSKPTDKVHCVIWDNLSHHSKQIKDAGFNLEADLEVMFEVKVGLNARSASLSLTVVRIVTEYTIAKLAAERDKTNARLKEEGLFEKNKALKLPFLPKRLGLLTSSGGTVINDFRAALDASSFGFELFWLPVSVQGTEAKRQIINGIKKLSARNDLDAILIFRGGGSKAELAIFNDYEVAKHVCLCPIPVVSAIGHQEDQSSVQDVSCLSFGVPKDIGRFFCDIVNNYREQITQWIQQIKTLGLRQVEVAKRELGLHCLSLNRASLALLQRTSDDVARFSLQLVNFGRSVVLTHRQLTARVLENIKHRLERVVERANDSLLQVMQFRKNAQNLIETASLKVENHNEILKQIGPEVQMKRGFTLLRAKDASYIASARNIKAGDLVDILFHDGVATAKVEEVENKKEII